MKDLLGDKQYENEMDIWDALILMKRQEKYLIKERQCLEKEFPSEDSSGKH